jgi:hypothetical protein
MSKIIDLLCSGVLNKEVAVELNILIQNSKKLDAIKKCHSNGDDLDLLLNYMFNYEPLSVDEVTYTRASKRYYDTRCITLDLDATDENEDRLSYFINAIQEDVWVTFTDAYVDNNEDRIELVIDKSSSWYYADIHDILAEVSKVLGKQVKLYESTEYKDISYITFDSFSCIDDMK